MAEVQIAFDPVEAARRFLTPRRRSDSPGISEERLWVDGPQGRIAITRAGTGPAVMLVHGWEGEAADLRGFLPGFLEAGHSVIAPDLPAHGLSDGSLASIPACAEALLAVQRHFGELQAVVAHSMGCAIAGVAAANGMAVRKLALLAAPARYGDYARAFAKKAGLDGCQTQLMIRALREISVDVEAFSLPAIAPRMKQRALFIHSRDDRVAPLADALETADRWPGARVFRVDGLGHRRILSDPVVIDTVNRFCVKHLGASHTGCLVQM